LVGGSIPSSGSTSAPLPLYSTTKTNHPYTNRQENTLFGNIAATIPQIWQHTRNNAPVLAKVWQQTPDSGNNAATSGNRNKYPYLKTTIYKLITNASTQNLNVLLNVCSDFSLSHCYNKSGAMAALKGYYYADLSPELDICVVAVSLCHETQSPPGNNQLP
jgi:hypothetical protein